MPQEGQLRFLPHGRIFPGSESGPDCVFACFLIIFFSPSSGDGYTFRAASIHGNAIFGNGHDIFTFNFTGNFTGNFPGHLASHVAGHLAGHLAGNLAGHVAARVSIGNAHRSPGRGSRAMTARPIMETVMDHADGAIPDCLSSGHFDRPLSGSVMAPGDKSLSHRALLIAAMASSPSRIDGLLESADVLHMAGALTALGIRIERDEKSASYRVFGCGTGGFAQPEKALDMGNSGTAARLLAGALATQRLSAYITGDASLCGRPMERIITPLSQMGAQFDCQTEHRLPMLLRGAVMPLPLEWHGTIASAQVKSAIILAGLNAPGRTRVVEPYPSRDHSERMLRFFGLRVDQPKPGMVIVEGEQEFAGCALRIAGDPSSCAVAVTAALLAPPGRVVCRGVCVNPLRTGFYRVLRDMGVNVTFSPGHPAGSSSGSFGGDMSRSGYGGEDVADIVIDGSSRTALMPIETRPERAGAMIDEYPLLAVICAFAKGKSRLRGLDELRHKESDRLSTLADNLIKAGVDARVDGDDLVIDADGTAPAGGTMINADLDHRMAMAFLVLGAAAKEPIIVDGCGAIATSFPGFISFMGDLGWRLSAAADRAHGAHGAHGPDGNIRP